jgi:hypothetical protein
LTPPAPKTTKKKKKRRKFQGIYKLVPKISGLGRLQVTGCMVHMQKLIMSTYQQLTIKK